MLVDDREQLGQLEQAEELRLELHHQAQHAALAGALEASFADLRDDALLGSIHGLAHLPQIVAR